MRPTIRGERQERGGDGGMGRGDRPGLEVLEENSSSKEEYEDHES